MLLNFVHQQNLEYSKQVFAKHMHSTCPDSGVEQQRNFVSDLLLNRCLRNPSRANRDKSQGIFLGSGILEMMLNLGFWYAKLRLNYAKLN